MNWSSQLKKQYSVQESTLQKCYSSLNCEVKMKTVIEEMKKDEGRSDGMKVNNDEIGYFPSW